jgi:hypothetical protein
VRLAANYVANFIGGFSHADAMDAGNLDARNLKSNYFYRTNRVDHEVLLRVGINL